MKEKIVYTLVEKTKEEKLLSKMSWLSFIGYLIGMAYMFLAYYLISLSPLFKLLTTWYYVIILIIAVLVLFVAIFHLALSLRKEKNAEINQFKAYLRIEPKISLRIAGSFWFINPKEYIEYVKLMSVLKREWLKQNK